MRARRPPDASHDVSRVRAASPDETATLPLPPGPRGRRIANLRSHFRGYPAFTERMHREFGDIVFYRMRVVGDCCLVFDRELIRAVLDAEGEGEIIR